MKRILTGGFSLVELMIVVAIVAVLIAIAMPNYEDYTLRSNRAVGKAELMEVAARQEQFFVNNKTYTNNLTNLGYPANPYSVTDHGDPQTAAVGSIYTLTVTTANDGLEFNLTAAPQGRQVKDTDCGTLGLDEQGSKFQSNGTTAATDACW